MDLDGTLLDSASQLPRENAVAIEEAAAQGLEIVIVTGRRFDSARAAAGLADAHFIFQQWRADQIEGRHHAPTASPAAAAAQGARRDAGISPLHRSDYAIARTRAN